MTSSFRAFLLALALLAAAPSLHAQRCTWKPERPRGAGVPDSIDAAIRHSQRMAVVGALRAAGVEGPHGLVAFSVHRNGASPLVRLFDANFPAAALDPIAAELVQTLLQQPNDGTQHVTGVVRLDSLPMPRMRSDGKRRDCKPVIADTGALRREFDRWKGPAGRAEVSFLIDRDGRVRHAGILSGSGVSEVDDFALQLIARTVFEPATVDGVPRDVWVSLPVLLL